MASTLLLSGAAQQVVFKLCSSFIKEIVTSVGCKENYCYNTEAGNYIDFLGGEGFTCKGSLGTLLMIGCQLVKLLVVHAVDTLLANFFVDCKFLVK